MTHVEYRDIVSIKSFGATGTILIEYFGCNKKNISSRNPLIFRSGFFIVRNTQFNVVVNLRH